MTQNNETLVDSLRSILEAYCLYRPDIGYVQGMACLAANFLMVMDEYSSFVCFSNLVVRSQLNTSSIHTDVGHHTCFLPIRLEFDTTLLCCLRCAVEKDLPTLLRQIGSINLPI